MSDLGDVPLPRYGEASIPDLVPSILTALDVPGFANPLGIEPVDRVALLLVDGLGWESLRGHQEEAPFLHGGAAEALTAGFPSTTAASIASIGTGVPPGAHGLVGYSIGRPGHDHGLNVLQWTRYGEGERLSLVDDIVPEDLQPEKTAFERAASAGVEVVRIAPRIQAHSGLSRAALRGGRFVATVSMGDVAAQVGAAMQSRRVLVYGYHADLDLTGHIRGVASDAWREELANVDRLVAAVARRLPRRSLLVVTGDHGMVDVGPDGRIEFDHEPDLQAGVRYLAGEGRARHVFTRPGAAADVAAAWRSVLGDRAWVATRKEAVAAGWFGPTVPDRYLGHVGDVVVAARDGVAVVSSRIAPLEASLLGHHGSFTAAEQLVPLVLFRT